MTQTRRTLLGTGTALLTASLAGCLFDGTSRGVADIVVHNETGSRQRFSLTVTAADGDIILDETGTLSADERAMFENKVAMEQTVTVEVSVTGGPSAATEWDVSNTFHVRIRAETIRFQQES